MMIKATIQKRIDGKYSLYAAENKCGYKFGELVKVVDTIGNQISQNFFSIIKIKIEPKGQKSIF